MVNHMQKTRVSPFIVIFSLLAPSMLFAQPNQKARYPGTITVHVDATDVAHRIFRVAERIPVSPGPFTLLFPKWEPGRHAPTGPIAAVAGLVITADGKRLEFKRDTIDVNAFNIEIPHGTKSIDVRYEMITPIDPNLGRVVMTPTMFNLQWIEAVLYPTGYELNQIMYKATLTVPESWKPFCALEVESRKGNTTHYKPIDFENLADSPVFAGKYYKTVDLDPGAKIPVRLDIVADDPRFLEINDDSLKAHRALVQQAYKLYNSKHYNHYDFLLSLSKQLSDIGLEHHRSSENRVEPSYFTEWDPKTNGSSLLPHEFTHSWNGKFRRPADLMTATFDKPMQDSLLWVYEGQTMYWGEVLAARAGLRTLQGALDSFALEAATYSENRPGFSWRSLQDTTNDPIMSYHVRRPYNSWQLYVDYYIAGAFMWMETDSKIREMTKGRKSLDDFASAFFGVNDGDWNIKTYTFDGIVQGLNNVVPYDWADFLRSRLDGHGPHYKGLEAAGWKLVFKDKPSPTQQDYMKQEQIDSDFIYSLGFSVAKDGKFKEVRWDSPAFRAGAAMGMKLVAVNDREYNKDYLSDAVSSRKPIKLLVKDFDVYRTIIVDYKGGLRYPYLERIKGKPDYLTPILTAR